MRYLALASDYDGTLAHNGSVDGATICAMERLIHSGRKIILVTGRELSELESVFPRLDLCERIVAENGAILYNPSTREKRRLAQRPPEPFITDLRNRGIKELSVGEVIVATWSPYEQQVMEAIREAGLELQIIFNKAAVMILPSGVNKMTGLCAALEELKLSRHNVVGIGDAENDHAFLESCECPVAVANAIPSLKERAALVTEEARGAGVKEVIEKLIANDLADIDDRLPVSPILIGKAVDQEVSLPVYGRNILICGQSGSGKSTLTTGLLERILAKKYQFCLIDPEGDYEGLEGCRTVGDEKHGPSASEVIQVLNEPAANAVVNLVGVAASDRPNCFTSFVAKLQELRSRVGRPHWIVIDEAHHVLPSEWAPTASELTDQVSNLILITVHPEHTSPAALGKINTVIVLGREPKRLLEEFAKVTGAVVPDVPERDLQSGEAAIWFVDQAQFVFGVQIEPCHSQHHRHKRKYAEGRLDEERVFHFRGPQDQQNLRAHNLTTFVQLAEGVNAETWSFHLEQGDYSRWFRDALKDTEMAATIEAVEKDRSLSDTESRRRIKEAVLQKYTAPA